jgi:hypothetical protein
MNQSDLHASTATNGRSASECHAKWPDRPSNAMQEPCYAGSRLYLGSRLPGSPENRYDVPHFGVHPANPGLVYFASICADALR